MPRTHYIVRLSKRAFIPGRSLTFRRGDEDPASVVEIQTEDLNEAERLARAPHDGCLAAITKVHRNGRQEKISSGFNMTGFASPEERARLDIGDLLDFVERIASMEQADGRALIEEARALLAKREDK